MRSELTPEEHLHHAEILLAGGDADAARAIIESGACGSYHTTATGARATWVLSQAYRALGLPEDELEMLKFTYQMAPHWGLSEEAEAARQRLGDVQS